MDYSLGSEWVTVPTASATYAFKDDSAGTALTGATKTETAPAAPIGFTNIGHISYLAGKSDLVANATMVGEHLCVVSYFSLIHIFFRRNKTCLVKKWKISI